MYQRVSEDPSVQSHYERLMRTSKGNHEYALRIATQSIGVPSPLYTNDQFWRGNRDDGFGNDNRSRQFAKRKAEAAGVSTAGKRFCQELCPVGESFSPSAWVSDRDDVKKVCEQHGFGLHGNGMNLPDPEIDTTPQAPYVADDLVTEEAKRTAEFEYGGDVTPTEFAQLKEQTRERVTPKEAPRGIDTLADLL